MNFPSKKETSKGQEECLFLAYEFGLKTIKGDLLSYSINSDRKGFH